MTIRINTDEIKRELDRQLPKIHVEAVEGGKLWHMPICPVVRTHPEREKILIFVGDEPTYESAGEAAKAWGLTRACHACFDRLSEGDSA